MNKHHPIPVALVLVAAFLSQQTVLAREPVMEKCYGVAKKGMNDCGSSTHSCAKQSVNDGDAEDWMYVPIGSCNKIVGGTLK